MKKKATNEQKAIALLDALDSAKARLTKWGNQCNEHIDAAGFHNDAKRRKQLIIQKHSIFKLADQFETLKLNVQFGLYTAQAQSELGKLPDAIAGCKSIVSNGDINFKKLQKDINEIFKNMGMVQEEIDKFNKLFEDNATPETNATPDTILNATGNNAIEQEEWFKAEVAASEQRMGKQLAEKSVAKPEDNPAAEKTDINDFLGLIEEENKRD